MVQGRGRYVHTLTQASGKVLNIAIEEALQESGINDQLKKIQEEEDRIKKEEEKAEWKSEEDAERFKKRKQKVQKRKLRVNKDAENIKKKKEAEQKEDGGKATEAVENASGGCYPGSATIVDIHFQPRKMESLKVGDVVQVVSDKEIHYEPVITFIHRQSEVTHEFLEITTLHGRKILKITEDHLVFVEKGEQAAAIPARDVIIGDTLYVRDDHNVVKKDEVQNIRFVWEKGVYAPVTLSGTILVNDVHTSCYFDVLSHEWSHWAMGVARAVYQVSPWMVKWMSNIGQKDGFPGWCRLAHKILTLME